jgi:UDP-N-acetylglucosamine 2-epimerase
MSKLKVMTILGTRPEIIRLSEVIKRCDKEFDHILVHTGQNYDYELSQIFFDELGVRKPDYYLNCAGKNLGKTMGNVISRSYDLIQEVKPDALLILGDTNSALSAISAKRLKCPIFHMEAGNRCWDWNVPEMTNRVMIDHISDVNMPYSHFAYLNLMREGLRKDGTFITGSPMLEVINAHRQQIEDSDILEKLHLEKGKYMVMSAHREENIDIPEKFNSLFPALNQIADEYKMPVIFSVHPRTRKKLEQNGFRLSPYIREEKPFGFFEYLKLQEDAFCVLSDSGTLTEESYILNFPAVLIRDSTERQEGNLAHTIAIGGVSFTQISEALSLFKQLDITKAGITDFNKSHVSASVSEQIKKYLLGD